MNEVRLPYIVWLSVVAMLIKKSWAMWDLEKIVKTGGSVVTASASMPLEASQNLFQSYLDYKKVAEQEKTRRAAIDAARDCYVAKVEASRRIFEQYLDLSFKERRENFDRYFNELDRAMERNDIQQMSVILSGINTLVATSPLKEAQNFMAQMQSSKPNELIEF